MTGLIRRQIAKIFFLNCRYNQISELDFSSNPKLINGYCSDNQLTCVNLKNGNNPHISYIDFSNNPPLTCIEVDDSASTWISFNVIRDPGVIYSNNCNNACSTIGVEEYESTDFSIYPNPTSSQLFIDVSTPLNNNFKAEIIDISGRTVKSINQVNYSIDVADIPKGIYFLKLTTDEGILTKKFVKE